MPTSVYIFLFVSLFAFIPACFDHRETWAELKEKKEKGRFLLIVKLCALWLIPISGLVGTAFLAVESFKSERQDAKRNAQYRTVTNQLAQSEGQVIDLSNKLAVAKLKSPKQKLIDLLNSINQQYVLKLKEGYPEVAVSASLDTAQLPEMEQLVNDPELSQCIKSYQRGDGMTFSTGMEVIGGPSGSHELIHVSFIVDYSLVR